MTLFATPISTSAKALLLATSLTFALSAHAQSRSQDPDAGEVARTPLRDFNISSEDIPQVLKDAALDPYRTPENLESCNDLVREIAAIDQVLGADFDIAQETEGGISRGRVAQSVVGSFIPFRGIVREVSGANARRNEANTAITAGMVRRAFLKGLGQQRGCSYPARPRPDRAAARSSE